MSIQTRDSLVWSLLQGFADSYIAKHASIEIKLGTIAWQYRSAVWLGLLARQLAVHFV